MKTLYRITSTITGHGVSMATTAHITATKTLEEVKQAHVDLIHEKYKGAVITGTTIEATEMLAS